MESEQFEFELSQYADGTLPATERAAVEERLRVDPTARELLAQYLELDRVIRAGAPAMPEMRWERVAEHLCEAVTGRRIISIAFYRRVGLAIAASLLVTVGVLSMRTSKDGAGEVAREVAVSAQRESLAVDSEVATSGDAGVMEVAVDQPKEAELVTEYSDGQGVLVERPTVMLAGYTK